MADRREEIKLRILEVLKQNNITTLEQLAADAAERCHKKRGEQATPVQATSFYVNRTFHMESDES